jgi:hypothetical protein
MKYGIFRTPLDIMVDKAARCFLIGEPKKGHRYLKWRERKLIQSGRLFDPKYIHYSHIFN